MKATIIQIDTEAWAVYSNGKQLTVKDTKQEAETWAWQHS